MLIVLRLKRSGLSYEGLWIGLPYFYKKHREDIWNRAISFVQNFDAANAKRSSLVIGNSKSRAAHWVPPDPSVFKLNVDAICDKSSGKVGLGIVVRNEGGDVVLAVAIAFNRDTDVTVVEV
ncbi:hypothetical protein ACOSQ3_031108 [Xanthoceras sorbifolium]